MSSPDAGAPATGEAGAPEEVNPDQINEVDEVRQGMLATLTERLGDDLVESHIERGDLWVRVRREAWQRALQACRDHLACDYFCFLSAIDWMPSQAPNPEAAVDESEDGDAAPEPVATAAEGWTTGVAGGDTRFQVLSRLYSTTRHWGLTLKADLPDTDPAVDSVVGVYRGAEWHERETWEMYGIEFAGHPGLRHLYLPGEFEGFPLRKDFPLLAREVKPWPGLVDVEPMPDEGDGEAAEEGEG